MVGALNREDFVARMREVGQRRYHDRHPFHVRMNEGKLTRGDLQVWAVNRYYYQRSIPIKDAAILSNCPDRDVRRHWVQRIVDHDGNRPGTGGIEAWLRLCDAVGVSREDVASERMVLPGVRFAVDAYVMLARTRPWLEAVASSLTELFAPALMSKRLAAFETHYPWVDAAGLAYFRARLTQAKTDSDYALALVLDHATAREQQDACIAALERKCDILWVQLEAIEAACAPRPAAPRQDG